VSETVASLLTPPGKAALATIALAGPGAWNVVRGFFQTIHGEALPQHPETGRFWLGRFAQPIGAEAVLAVRSANPPIVEFHVHGGYEVTRYLLEPVSARGIVTIPWQVLLERYEFDPYRAKAAEILARTITTRTAGIALDQYQGAFATVLRQAEALIGAGDRDRARDVVRDALRYADVGRRLTTPWRVVIAGPPNAGKSSLVNALAGYQRSVVSPTPGTTRDVVSATLAIDGWPVEVMDTAGLRASGESLEQLGIGEARAAVANADLVLWLMDASTSPVWPEGLLDRLPRLRLVLSKIDLPAAWDLERANGALRISAATGQGMSEFVNTLGAWLVPDPPPQGMAVPLTDEWIERLNDMVQ
jgi:tRNA modification GTPase